MLSFPQRQALVAGILAADNATKQRLGQQFAVHLRLNPGPGGPDDGIDGVGIVDGRLVHFQCKLRKTPLDRDDARLDYSDVRYHKAAVSVLLAGVGYKDTFRERLFGHPDLGSVKVHLLTLEDLFCQTEAFELALTDLPRLEGLDTLASSPGD